MGMFMDFIWQNDFARKLLDSGSYNVNGTQNWYSTEATL
jgi:hypothetical protein